MGPRKRRIINPDTLMKRLSWTWNSRDLRPAARKRRSLPHSETDIETNIETLNKLKRKITQRKRPMRHTKPELNKNISASKRHSRRALKKNLPTKRPTRKASKKHVSPDKKNIKPIIKSKTTPIIPQPSTELKVVGFKICGKKEDLGKKPKFQTIKRVYWPKPSPPKEETVHSDTEYISETDSERLSERSRSPSPVRPKVCTFIKKGPTVDKPLVNLATFISKNGRIIKTPEFDIKYRVTPDPPESKTETPKRDETRPRIKLPPLDEIPDEMYDKNGKLVFKYRKPSVLSLLLLERGLITIPDNTKKNKLADIDIPGLRCPKLLASLEELKIKD